MSILLCTAGYDHTIRFWAAPTGHCIEKIAFADSQVNRLAASPDHTHIAASGNPAVRLYDAATKQAVRSFDGHTGNVTGLGFLKNSNWIYTAGEDGCVKIWDLRASAPSKNFKWDSAFTCAVIHPNQAEVLLGDSDGRVCVWDLTSSKFTPVKETEAKVAVRDISVSADAKTVVAANSRGTYLVWDLTTWSPISRVDAHESYILSCVLSPDAKFLATASADRTVKIWDVYDNYSLHKTLTGHQRWVWDCAWSADSAYLVTASSDKTARLWEVSSGEPVVEYRGHLKGCTSIVLNDNAV